MYFDGDKNTHGCKLIQYCDTNTKIGVFSHNKELESIFDSLWNLTCHKCLSEDRIPVVFSNNGAVERFSINIGKEKLKDVDNGVD